MPPSGTSSLQTKWLLLPLAHAIAPHAKRIEKAHPLLISALPRTHWLKLSHGRSARVFVYAACAAAGMAQALPAMAQTSPAANPPVPAAPETSKKPPETTAPTEQQPAVQALPPVVVTETAAPAKKPKAAAHKAKTVPSAVKPSAVTPSAAAGTQPAAVSAPASLLAIQGDAFNQARSSLLTQVGTNSFTFSREAIEALPQGTETPVSKLLLQAPGVTQNSAASGQIHVRNEHANLQYRINGIILPDGVSGFGEVLKSDFVGSLSLVTGALPAEYGLRTSGLVDITTRAGSEEPGGNISVYGGSRGTLTPSIEYGGTSGAVDYFFTGRYLMNDEGIENPTPSWEAIHDHTDQGFGFGYVSALIDNSTRLSWISGVTVQNFQIPNTPGLPPVFMVNGVPPGFNSSRLNEHQFEQNYYDVIALQKKLENIDWQLAYFARYSDLHFHPDLVGDLVLSFMAPCGIAAKSSL